MKCDFTEKEYEHFMNRELKSKVRIFMPSPYDEGKYFGVDAAVFSKDPFLWNMWSFIVKNWQSGVKLDPRFWEITEDVLKNSPFLKFRYNLFLQYKKPDYLTRPKKSEQYKYWKHPFLRYDIDEDQQDILFKLEKNIAGQALVVYACASFWRWIDPNRNSFIQNSNYVQPHKLQDHYQYTFVKSGKDGCAFSEPSPIEGLNLLRRLAQMEENTRLYEDNIQFLQATARSIKEVIMELDEQSKYRFQTIQRSSHMPDSEFGSNIITILNFNLFANTSWGIGFITDSREISNGRIKGLIDSL